MVGNNAHGDIGFFIGSVGNATQCSELLNNRLEDVGVVVRLFALHGHTQTFEAHARVDYFCRQRLERTIGLAVELHEHIVPDFNHLRMTTVYQRQSINFCPFVVGANVDMNFRAGTARTRIAHFPEIIFFISIDNARGRQELLPDGSCFVVALQPFGRRTFEYGNIKPILVELENFS